MLNSEVSTVHKRNLHVGAHGCAPRQTPTTIPDLLDHVAALTSLITLNLL